MLKVQALSGGYTSAFQLKDIHFHVKKGEFFGIIGPNGSGKTTLVKMISGILQAEKGTINLQNRPIRDYRPKQLAQKLAVLPQLTEQSFRYTVQDIIALGRYAYQTGLFTTLTKEDQQIIDEVMALTHTKSYAHLTIDQLSGGERQRVFLAQALAQEPDMLILDEPTNHLDLTYQKELLDLLNKWTRERGLTVVSIFHDLNLAALYCDRLLLLHDGHVHRCGAPHEVIHVQSILDVYETEVETSAHPTIPTSQVMLTPEVHTPRSNGLLQEKYIKVKEDTLSFTSPVPLKTISTNAMNMQNNWYAHLMCRSINVSPFTPETIQEAKEKSFRSLVANRSQPLLFLSLAKASHYVLEKVHVGDLTLYCIVLASVKEKKLPTQTEKQRVLTSMNVWVLIDGHMLDHTLIQAMVTATEAKLKTLQVLEIAQADVTSGQINLDQLLVASTQHGPSYSLANPTSPLGKRIKEVVTKGVTKSLQI